MIKASSRKAEIYSAYEDVTATNKELETQQRILFVISGLLLITHML